MHLTSARHGTCYELDVILLVIGLECRQLTALAGLLRDCSPVYLLFVAERHGWAIRSSVHGSVRPSNIGRR
jgi:hypothetical protein